MLRFISVEVLFRISMMLLKTNEETLLTQMEKNPQNVSNKIKASHETKMTLLLSGMYPSRKDTPMTPKAEFETLEKWLGHDLFVSGLMAAAKTSGQNLVFAKQIPKLQWDAFCAKEVKKGRDRPQSESKYPYMKLPVKNEKPEKTQRLKSK